MSAQKIPIKKALIKLARWFTSNPEQSTELSGLDNSRVEWFRTLPFWGVHLMFLGIIWVGWSWTAVGVAATLSESPL